MAFRFEFDKANRILLLRVEGRLSDELLKECYEAIRKYSTATDASAGIFARSSARATFSRKRWSFVKPWMASDSMGNRISKTVRTER